MPEGYHRGLERYLMAPFAEAMLAASPPRGRCLDLACGPGLVARQLPADAVGVDAWDEMVAYARSLAPRRAWVCADMERLPFRDASFGSVYCSQGLQFAESIDGAIREARRVGESYAALVWRDLLASPGFAALDATLRRRLGDSPIASTHLDMKGERVRRVVRFPSARAFLEAYVQGSSLLDRPGATGEPLVADLERALGHGEVAFPVEATLVLA